MQLLLIIHSKTWGYQAAADDDDDDDDDKPFSSRELLIKLLLGAHLPLDAQSFSVICLRSRALQHLSPQVPVLYNIVLAHGIGISRLHACIREQQTVLLACSFQSRPYPPNSELAPSYLSSYSSWVSSWLTRFRRCCTAISVSWWFDGESADLLVPADSGVANSNP